MKQFTLKCQFLRGERNSEAPESLELVPSGWWNVSPPQKIPSRFKLLNEWEGCEMPGQVKLFFPGNETVGYM